MKPDSHGSSNLILVVAKNPSDLAALSHIISRNEFFNHPSSGSSLDDLVGPSPALVLLDEDHVPLITALQTNKVTKGVPVILLIGANQISDKKKMFGQGVADFITKPILEEEVLLRIRTHLYSQEKEAERIRLTAIMENTSDLVSTSTVDKVLTYMNKAGKELLGWPVDCDISTRSIHNAHPDWAYQKIEKEGIPQAIETGLWCGQTALRNRDGKEIPTSQVVMAHRSKTGELEYLSTIIRDLSLHQEIDEKLREKEYIIESASSAICTSDLEGRVTYVNPIFLKIWEYQDQTEILGKHFSEFWDVPDRVDEIMTALQVHKSWTDEIKAIKKDGTRFDVQVAAALVCDKNGKPISLMSSSVDITKRKKAEYRFRLAAKVASDLIYEWDIRDDTLLWFGDIDKAFGYEPGAFPRTIEAWIQRIHPEDMERLKDAVALHRTSTKPIHYEYRVQRKDGRWRHWLDHGIPMLDQNNKPYKWVGVCSDITERKEAEEETRRLRNLLQNIVDSMPSILVGVDVHGRVTQWNREAEKQTGTKAESAINKNLDEVFPQLANGMSMVGETIKSGFVHTEQKVASKKDNQTRYNDITIYPLLSNGVEGAVIRVDDITEKVRIEEMMIQSEKMLSVGGLAAGMAHEINNPLAGVIQNAQNVLRRLFEKMPSNVQAAANLGVDMETIHKFMEAREIPHMLDSVINSGIRAAKIVENMLNFSRMSDIEFHMCNLADLLDQTIELAENDYDLKKKYDFRKIHIKRNYEKNMPELPCQKNKIQQVFLNILKNGAQAMASIKDQSEKKPCFILNIRTKGKMARIEISDNGPGMDEDICKRIFEPFFTTKSVGSGTGLGLSISYFIITENHNGSMAVRSAPDKGASFIIDLPFHPIENKT